MNGRQRLTRRQVLGGLAAAGLAGVGLAVLGIERVFNSTASTNGAATVAAAAGTGLPPGLPVASAPPVGPRHAYPSRPDLTPPAITVSEGSGDDGSAGFIFLTPGNGAGPDGPLIVDATGEPIWVGPDSGMTVTGLTVVQLDGAPALSWWEGQNNNGIGFGEFVFVDASYHEIRRLTGASGAKADLHELRLTPYGSALLFVAVPIKSGLKRGRVLPWPIMDCVVQEIDLATGASRFEWSSADHIDLEESLAEPPTEAGATYDYVHGNAIELDLDGNLLVSARNTSTIYKVDRASGDVIWRMGGKHSDFAIAADAVFGWQHDVRRLADGTLTIFDNAHSSAQDVGGHPSRAIVVEPDEATMTVRLVREYPHPSPLISSSQGSVQVLPSGELLVGWGSTPWFTQFRMNGDVVFDATFPAAKQSYRSRRFQWVGGPAEPPRTVLEPTGPGAFDVLASWNGHTGVATWEVLAGASATDELAVIASAARTGFETRIPISSTLPLVAVRARDAAGNELGRTEPIATPA